MIRFSSFDQSVRITNGVRYGLSSAVYIRNVNQASQAMEALEHGITSVNAPTIGVVCRLSTDD